MSDQREKLLPLTRRFTERFFSPRLDLRVRLFNVLAMGGALVSLLSAIVSFLLGERPSEYGLYLPFCLLSLALLYYSAKTGRYQRCYIITVVLIFLIGFPVFFFLGGGYYGAIPYFFVFAILFTVFMLQGRRAIVLSALELIVYISICVYAWLSLPVPSEFVEPGRMLVESVFGFSVVSAVLGICMYLHFRLYNEQQKKLDEQNAVLAQGNRMKNEFLANASHEMRTPLTVISVDVQTVMEILEDMDPAVIDPEAGKLLQNAQNEIMRLSRMVGGMLTLASMTEKTNRRRLDLSSLLQGDIEMLRLNLAKGGNAVETDIEPGLSVFGNADLLAQVLSNILQNAGAHTSNGTVRVEAKRLGGEITVTVRDTGPGISPEMLPHVFERGISTGGTGFGLYLCKIVVESHGGRIWIQSEPGKGTAVSYVLPFYEGQFEGGEA